LCLGRDRREESIRVENNWTCRENGLIDFAKVLYQPVLAIGFVDPQDRGIVRRVSGNEKSSLKELRGG
jgi:hypothetical protein